MSHPFARIATTLAGVAAALVFLAPGAGAQSNDDVPAFLRNVANAVEEEKRILTDTMIVFVADLEGVYGHEGYRLRAAAETMQASLARWDSAVGTLERAVGSLDTAGARLVLSLVYLDQHRIDDALRECQRAIELAPMRPDGYALLGRIRLARSQTELAADAFLRGTMADPSEALNWYQLAAVSDALGHKEEATSARQAFVRAAERRLSAFWNDRGVHTTVSSAKTPWEPRRFVTRRAPVDMLASADGGVAGFLPSAYESAARYLSAGNYVQGVAALADVVGRDPLTRDIPEPGGSLTDRLRAARRSVAAPSAAAAAYASLGHVLMALEQPTEARQAFERALALDRTLETPRLRLASLALLDGKGNEALNHLKAAVKQHPGSTEARRLLSTAYWAAGDLDAAVTELSVALGLKLADERLRTSLQTALLFAPRRDDVEAGVTAAVAAHPRSGSAQQNLGRFYQSAGRNQNAVAVYHEALQLYPLVATHRLHMRMAGIHTRRMQVDEAIGSYRAALAVDPNNVVPRLWIARLLMEGSQLGEAYAELLVTLLLEPRNAEAHARVAQLELRRGQFTQAVAAARRVLAEDPDHLEARYTLAQALVRSGEVDDGRSQLAEYARRQSEREERERRQRELSALTQEALGLVGAGQLDRAIELLRQAVDINPTATAHANLGAALMDAGRFEEAVESLEVARELAEHSEVVRLYLADAYAALGQLEESARARAIYERMSRERQQSKRR